MDIDILDLAKKAKNAFIQTMNLNNEAKNLVLSKIIDKLKLYEDEIYKANEEDLKEAKDKVIKSIYDRLKFNKAKFNDLIKGIEDLISIDDPVNNVLWQKELDKNLILKKISTPIGVIGVIFEARPDCFIQIASLIIKSGNCALLKGGSECIKTNTLFNKILKEALKETGIIPLDTINLIYSREDIKKILTLDEYIDLIIPRGSNELVKYIKENTKIPVLGHSSGICHIFLDESADFNAKDIIIDSKTQYPSACNSVETLLIHKDYKYKDELKKALLDAGIKLIENPKNYSKEYSDKILALKIVQNLDCAIEHINKYGSKHTDCIISKNKENIEKFMNLVDSSSVYSNCSTRFADGFRYGFGAEVGISTNKTHARGPVGLEGLTIYKYKLYGNGDIVAPYANGKKNFSHKFI